ncbi:hypothetical protein WR25_13261 isoform B [Diploscapter pachys]|nr:hypothetical protein WR25_13261 isoform B [Diploscapter pachys]
MPNSRKQLLARSLDGGVLNTVTQILDHFAHTSSVNVHVKVPTNLPKPPAKQPKQEGEGEGKKAKKGKQNAAEGQKPALTKGKEDSDTDESDASSSEDSEDEQPKQGKKKTDSQPKSPVSDKKSLQMNKEKSKQIKESAKKQKEDSDDGESEGEEDVKMASGDDDSTDEEAQMKMNNKGGKRKGQEDKAVQNGPKPKKTKLDLELEKYVGVDESTLDPVESRHLAMLKLQKKIENMKVSRKGQKSKKISGKRAAELERERKLKRRMSKLKMKQKRAQAKAEKKGSEDSDAKPNGGPAAPVSVKVDKDGKQMQLPLTDDGKIAYSKFDFIVKQANHKKKRLSRKEKGDKFTGKDYRSLLHKVEKRKEKLEGLSEKDPEKAKSLEEEIKWNRAMKRASGVKVKDDENLLMKGLKRKEKDKAKKKEKWEQRVGKVEKDIQERQDKRKENIRKRVEEKKKRKLANLRKKGKLL